MVLYRVPISWRKSAGGRAYEWIGYAQDLATFKVGISSSRANWLVKWINEKLTTDKIQGKETSEVLGRFNFAAAAIDVTKPFLGPTYMWAASVPEFAILKVPVLIKIILCFLGKIYSDPDLYMIEAREPTISTEAAFRGDAHASADSIGIGGWQSDVEVGKAQWFSVELNRANASWAYSAGESFRKIASLELYTTLLCAMKLPVARTTMGRQIALTAETDNMGNSFAVGRWSTTKAPLSMIMMELAVQCRRRGLDLHLAWIPRLQNMEADELSNGVTHRFCPENEVRFKIEELDFILLPEMLEYSEELYSDADARKARRKAWQTHTDGTREVPPAKRKSLDDVPMRGRLTSGAAKAKRAKETRLRARDPW